MAITLDTVELPDDLAWPDRYAWQSVDVSVEYSLTGAAIVQSAEKQAGRPITLQSSQQRAWIARTTVDALKTLQADADATYSLSVRGESYTVVIQSVDAEPLWDLADDSDQCALTLKLIEV